MSGTQTLIQMVYLDFAGGPFRAHSGVGVIQWNGHDWLGTGNLGAISSAGESTELQPAKVQVGLSGLPPEIVGLSLREHYQGRRAQIRLALIEGTADPCRFRPHPDFFRPDRRDAGRGRRGGGDYLHPGVAPGGLDPASNAPLYAGGSVP